LPSKRQPLAVGLTGGIGSGKTVVAAVLARLGARVISADDEAKALLASDPAVVRKITRLLGQRAYTSSGAPDRAYIASRIFSNPRERRRVNAVIHPAVIARTRRMIAAEKRRRSTPLVVVEAALIYEAGMERLFDAVVVVDSPVAVRAARIVERDGASRADALRRIRSQGSGREKAARADVVIRNRGDLRSLRAAGRFLFRLLAGPSRT
jgi:dephospho-CoA kinase